MRSRNGSGIPLPGQNKTNSVTQEKSKIGKTPETQKAAKPNGKLKGGFGLKKPSLKKTDTNNNKNSKNVSKKNSVKSPETRDESPLGALHGNGVGGGSVAKTGFLYQPAVHQIRPNSRNENNNNSPVVLSRETSPITRGIPTPVANSRLPPSNSIKKCIPAPKSKLSLLKPKAVMPNNKNFDALSSPSGNDSSSTTNALVHHSNVKPQPRKSKFIVKI